MHLRISVDKPKPLFPILAIFQIVSLFSKHSLSSTEAEETAAHASNFPTSHIRIPREALFIYFNCQRLDPAQNH